MPEGLKNIFNKLVEVWNKLDTTKKITLGIVLAIVVGAFAFIGSYSKKPAMEVLYDNLSASD
jgi:flagellar biosynthesis/type III secretory pathway M-ring protein FliF/YscJ